MKQNLQLHYFYGKHETAIRTPVWCTLIARLLPAALQKKTKVEKAFSTVATPIRMCLICLLDIYELLRGTKRFSEKQHSPLSYGQLSLNFT
jgi:hypothetical protein